MNLLERLNIYIPKIITTLYFKSNEDVWIQEVNFTMGKLKNCLIVMGIERRIFGPEP
jgi:hypothetical protein